MYVILCFVAIFYTNNMVINSLLKVDGRSVRKLSRVGRLQNFNETASLLYRGHIPIVAYLVIQGEINLYKNNKLISVVKSNEVIGVKELLTDTPSTLTAEVMPDSIICYLDKSTILSILDEEDSALSDFFYEIIYNN